MRGQFNINRRSAILGLAAFGASATLPAGAQAKGLGLGSILGKASDSALDQLAQPGAFYNDKDIRIGLPLIGGQSSGLLGGILNAENRLGILKGITREINDAAGIAAGEAKPIFRTAIDDLSFDDVPGIVSKNDGGTRYLKSSAGSALHEKLLPLVQSALGKLGVHEQFDAMAQEHSFIRATGLNRDTIDNSVTEQGLDGIFSYMGKEEATFRKNPLRDLGGVLRDAF